MALKERHLKFIDLYIAGMDASHAVVKSGWKCNPAAAAVQATRLLKNTEIKTEIERRQKVLTEKTDIKKEVILNGLKNIFDNGEQQTKDRINAAAQINKMLGFYASEKVDVQHSGQISCVVELPNNNRMKK